MTGINSFKILKIRFELFSSLEHFPLRMCHQIIVLKEVWGWPDGSVG